MIVISAELVEEIIAHAREGIPNEVCGWLAGKGERVERVYPVSNVAGDPRVQFEMDPEIQLSTMREIKASGLELTGTYHSHPNTPAFPSRRDLSLSLYPESSHVIVSLMNSHPDVRCYRITPHNQSPVELVIPPQRPSVPTKE